MALKFYWRCESNTHGVGDYSSGDTVATDSNVTYGADGAKIGTNGLIGASGVAASSTWNPASILANSADVDTAVGSCGFWWQAETAFPASGVVSIFKLYANASTNNLQLEARTGPWLRFEVNNQVPETANCEIDTAMSTGVWYFIVCRWDIANDKIRLEVYTDAGDSTLTPFDSAETTSGIAAVVNSTDFGVSAFDALQFGVKGSTASRLFLDNVILSDAYGAPIQNNAFITTSSAYSESTTTTYLKLLAHSSAASATGVEGWVVGDDNTTYYGKFTGQAFDATLTAGTEAVLYVPTADISPDGATLTTSDTPQVVVRNTTYGTTMCDATVIEE